MRVNYELIEDFTRELREVLSDFEVEACVKPFSSCHTSESDPLLERVVDPDPSQKTEGAPD